VHPLAGNIAECLVDDALPHHAAEACECRAFDLDCEVRFARTIIATMAVMRRAVVDHGKREGREGGGEQRFHFDVDWAFWGHIHPFLVAAIWALKMPMNRDDPSPKRNHDRFHGRVRGASQACAHPGCSEAGEFRAPGYRPPGTNGPGDYRWLCLEHVRIFNARYNFFEGMTRDEIDAAQTPFGGWPSETRAFTAGGADSPPKWRDFHDPLDAISARFRERMPKERTDGKPLSPQDRAALKTLSLSEDADRRALRLRYSELVRTFHPDRNGGDRSHEKALQAVVEAYQQLRVSPAFA
jgi:hypothetical protein